MEDYIEFDKLKTKVLKYALYKKRSEAEIRRKFAENSGEMLDEVIENLKENGYKKILLQVFLFLNLTLMDFIYYCKPNHKRVKLWNNQKTSWGHLQNRKTK